MKSKLLILALFSIIHISCKEEHFPNTKFLDSNFQLIESSEINVSLDQGYQLTITSEFELIDDNPVYSLSINNGPIQVINDSSFMLPHSSGYSGPHDLYNKSDILNLTQESGYFVSKDVLILTVSHSNQEFTKAIKID